MSKLWTDEARFGFWLEIETIAMEGMVKEGLVPESALKAVKEKGGFNVDRILELERELKHDVIAFLTNVKEHVGEEARYLHFGMTSSDLLDTCLAVQLTKSADLIIEGIEAFLEGIKSLALKHKDAVSVGRSHGIHAEPISFAVKCANWYSEVKRCLDRVKAGREAVAYGAISGPVGTFAHLPPTVEGFVCDKLGLKPAPVSSQVIQRDGHAAFFTSLAVLAGAVERVAIEIRHLQRTEVREAEEQFTKGQKGSSAMPHKRNPILTENVTGLCRLVRSMSGSSLENIALWHERDISHSSVERVVGPDICILSDFILARMTMVVNNLVVYPENMQKNLEMTGGLVFSGTLLVALAAKGLSREDSYKLVQDHCMSVWEAMNQGETGLNLLKDRVLKDEKISEVLNEEELDECFRLDRHLAHTDTILERAFAS